MNPRKTPFDYAFLFGLPIVFLAIAWFGITSLLGPAPPTRAVTLIKEGKVAVGMPIDRAVNEVGAPKDIESYPDGTQGYVYHQGTAEPFIEEEATLIVSESGVILRIKIEKSTVPAAETR